MLRNIKALQIDSAGIRNFEEFIAWMQMARKNVTRRKSI